MPAAKPRLGVTLRQERKRRLMTVRDMAEALREAAPAGRERESVPRLTDLMRMYRNWESDRYGVSERYQVLFCRVFDMTLERLLVGSHCGMDTGGRDVFWSAEEDDVERRRMIQALAVLGGAAMSPMAQALQAIQANAEAGLGRGVAAQLDDWEETLVEYGFTYLTTPPQRLLGELAADLVSVQSMRIKEGHPEYTRWCRVTGGLSGMMAKTLSLLGQAREARPWWSTAQHAADTSGDVELSLWVSGEHLIHGLYQQRPVPVLLRQSDAVLGRLPHHPCAGLATLRSLRAQTLATVGRPDEAAAEIRQAEEVFVRLPAEVTRETNSTLAWGEDCLRYTEAWVYAYSGSQAELDASSERALDLYGNADRRSTTQIRLIQAFSRVRTGDVTEGIKHASSAYAACRAEQRTAGITRLADLVMENVPSGQRAAPSVTAYRELLSAPKATK
ncbi:hypothetical protein [Actinomadura sp. DC4]|uniref:hypothetical protein n=1 Tax=Actinomadura sp. DC4 TaxID=3055069 RepID=UPI0025B18010|nr:hypothetical protein [Actinomadura sp. DC4]MDN3355576.1 hypothetical protein [Actinomadura sp. DC4]